MDVNLDHVAYCTCVTFSHEALFIHMSNHLLIPQEKFTPVKYFSIDRVFRNETLDATHLAEFHQIEGVVADYGLTLGDLMGVLHQFFTKLGNTTSAHDGVKSWRGYCEHIIIRKS